MNSLIACDHLSATDGGQRVTIAITDYDGTRLVQMTAGNRLTNHHHRGGNRTRSYVEFPAPFGNRSGVLTLRRRPKRSGPEAFAPRYVFCRL